jgi:ATP-dependent Lhr-like helicase
MQSFGFHPVLTHWFEQKFGSPTEPQVRGWPIIKSGKHTLIAAPTGSGKTLAAFFAALDELFRDGLAGKLKDETRILYVSPLKALSNDIHKNLEEPLAGIRAALLESEGADLDVRAEVRTGDTPAAKRQAMARKPPHILVTTPESLYLLLTSISGRKLLATVRTLIVDEIHAVVGNRRGSHLALSMERLNALVGQALQRIGLSATQKPVEEVARFLVGSSSQVAERAIAASQVAQPAHWDKLPYRRFPVGIAGDNSDASENIDGSQAGSPAIQQVGNLRYDGAAIVDFGYAREMDLAIELPGSPLEAVMSNEVWTEVYERLASLIEAHRTTLVFVNTRRLAERVTHHLCQRLGQDKVTSHHGSLSAKLRLEAEDRLKRGELKALVATASLELGIDIGSVELVCQIGPTRSIATLLQRVGRARHQRGGLPRGRIFPLTRDELIECSAMLRSVREGQLDCLVIPEKPLDVLAQQIVACAATEDWDEERLFELARAAYPYRNLSREEFNKVVRMLAEGYSTKRGRRGALLHHDAVNQRVRARRGARLVALTSGGAIPDNADYRVVVEPSETFIGTVNEDFAIESMAGDIFQLGNASWRILRVNAGMVRVEDARGQPPSIPFWLGEAPGRTAELSAAVSRLREEVERQIEATVASADGGEPCTDAFHRVLNTLGQNGTRWNASLPSAWLQAASGIPESAARQLSEYFLATYKALGVVPSQKKLVIERFFDESGGMQLVIHSPFGIRLNRAWGLALRKRFCRSFNFELQAAATDDAIVLSLGTQHSFPLDEVFRYLNSKTVRDLLVQALLDAPMFTIRWRWNAGRSLALPRQRGGRKIPAPLQRMEAENLLASVFPDQLACLENIVGDREVPDHPLVSQTIEDCLSEAMDIDGLIELLKKIEQGTVECIARDLPEPSPMAHEILNARPYAFLDNAPLEERRTQAVYTRRAGDISAEPGLGILDAAAIEKVCAEAWPQATNADELHEALLLAGALTEDEVRRMADSKPFLELLSDQKRAGRLKRAPAFWIAAERLPMLRAVYEGATAEPALVAPEFEQSRSWEREEAVRELVRGRMEISGPLTASELAALFNLPRTGIDAALLALEAEGFVLRGKFRTGADRSGDGPSPRTTGATSEPPGTGRPRPFLESAPQEIEWCDRRLLARIHRLTINKLRAEIQPVSILEFQRFLLIWQRVGAEHRSEGPEGLAAVLEVLDGYELPAAAWEPEVLALRVREYTPRWLDQLCFTGRIGWGRLTPPAGRNGRPAALVRSSPVSLFSREHLPQWLALSAETPRQDFSPDTVQVLTTLAENGAQFFHEIVGRTGLLPSRVEQALAELSAQGWATADSFEGLRALLLPQEKRTPFADQDRKRHHKAVTSVEYAGRWSLLRIPEEISAPTDANAREAAVELFARTLLRRYGVVFRRLLERESFKVSWYELGRVYRRLEARGEIRGGYFVSGVSGEQFALSEAINTLRSLRKTTPKGELITISGADPLNLLGILAPGSRLATIAANRMLFRDGLPVATLESGQVNFLEANGHEASAAVQRALQVGSLPPALRLYYSHS